jgi:transcriptional regulator with XRE-family HTH domain
MRGDKLKALREAKCWSQAHLAKAAEINIRTVQRIEGGEPCAPETMLSLAAALGVDLSELGLRTDGHTKPKVALAAAFVAPAALFVIVNLLRSVAGFNEPFNLFATIGAKVMDFRTFNLVSPILFIGGAAAALALTLPTLVRFHVKVDRRVVSVSGVDLVARPLALIVAAAAIVSGAALLLYAAAEELRSPIS